MNGALDVSNQFPLLNDESGQNHVSILFTVWLSLTLMSGIVWESIVNRQFNAIDQEGVFMFFMDC